MAWTVEHRRAADRRGLRYPSDLTDAEWALVAPLIRPPMRGGRPRTVNVREQAGREASPTTAIIDSQTAKAAQKGALRSTRPVTMRTRRWSAASATC